MSELVMSPEVRRALVRYEQDLENLTFNSKPLIDDLTRSAEVCRPIGGHIIEKIESRILQVRTDWKLPSLYLLDSIMKNLKGNYLDCISRVIVGVFCHCFEKLSEPEARKSLYKLRTTWPPYLPIRKLAAIDRHVHALDPNWPIVATETDPPSPTIFVNPKFISGASDEKQSAIKTVTSKSSSAVSTPMSVESSASSASAPKKYIAHTKKSAGPSIRVLPAQYSTNSLSVQAKRKKLLEKTKAQKREQQKAMLLSSNNQDINKLKGNNVGVGSSAKDVKKVSQTLTPPATPNVSTSKLTKGRSLSPAKTKQRRSASPASPKKVKTSPARARSISPLMPGAIPQKTRSASPLRFKKIKKISNEQEINLGKAENTNKKNAESEATPPSPKRPKLEREIKKEPLGSDDIATTDQSNQKAIGPQTLKESHLQLDDVPSELLPKHHENILKKIEQQLDQGNLTSGEHGMLVNQLEQLYKLQKLKGQTSSMPPANANTTEQSDSTLTNHSTSADQNINSDSFVPIEPSEPFPSHPSRGRDHYGPPSRLNHHQNHRGFPPVDRYPVGPMHPESRDMYGGAGRPRAPRIRSRGLRRGGPWRYPRPYPRGRAPQPWRGAPDNFMDNEHDYVPPSSGGDRSQPSGPLPGPTSSDSVSVSALFKQLVKTGMISDQADTSAPLHPKKPPPPSVRVSPPLSIPTLSFTPATLKQRYSALISLILAGEPCSSCGLRFTDQKGQDYRDHLNWHYKMNRMEKEGVRSTQNWFMHPEDWLKLEELSEENEEKESSLKAETVADSSQRESSEPGAGSDNPTSCQVLPGEGEEVCTLCQEPFEQFWEEEEEAWHFKDAIRIDDSKLYHTFCYKDAEESGALDNSNASKLSDVEAV